MADSDLVSGSRSRLEALNAQRERLPASDAMQELDRTLAGLEHRLMEFKQGSTKASARRAQSTPFGESKTPLRLDHIENRLSDMERQIALAPTQHHDYVALFQKLEELSRRIEDLSDRQALPGRVTDQLAHHMNLLAHQVAKVVDGLSHNDYRNLETQLDIIGEKLEVAEKRALETQPVLLDTIERRFTELTERLDHDYSMRYLHSDAIANLEAQIGDIARHLAKPAIELAEITPRLASIERSIVNANENVLEAARVATETAIERAMQKSSHGESTIAQQLAADIKSLETLARNADDRNSRTFETVTGTLSTIAERLTRLENEVNGKPTVAPPLGITAQDALDKSAVFDTKAKAVFERGDQKPPSNDETEKTPPTIEPVSRLLAQKDEHFSGEQLPDLNTILKRVREERRRQEDPTEEASAAFGKRELITAARRAAEIAVTQSQESEEAQDRRNNRKFILLAIGAVLFAITGLQIGSAYFSDREPVEVVADQAIETLKDPASQPAKQQVEPVKGSPMPAATALQSTKALHISVPVEVGPIALREAAAQGDRLALFEIGNRYMDGRGVPADMSKAASWYEKAAGKGFAPAQYRIASFNEKGRGVPLDLKKARAWYEKAAHQGNASAMHNLAVLIASGKDGPSDNVAAAHWFARAAELGIKDSQFNMGILAAKGVGMPANLEESYKWFALAANAGDREAADKRDQIAASLDPEKLEQAKASVLSFQTKPMDTATNSITVPDAWEKDTILTGSIDTKKTIQAIQIILRNEGYAVGAIDGTINDKTREAITVYQKANGLNPTGVIDHNLTIMLFQKKD
ncbi:peptidoglycan-binding protein [Brucella sp. BE17]|uniref:peptidoglycan-binding protein n=1 Tax=Brucella sp. BE17 TaxID=3142977 RepID=UPI0031BB5474